MSRSTYRLLARSSSLASGFTLLEVLIALALFSTLMGLLWSLFSTYTRLAERSRYAANEIQLVRSLSSQMRSDLDHFAYLTPPLDPMPASPRRHESPPGTDATPDDADNPHATIPMPLEQAHAGADDGAGLEHSPTASGDPMQRLASGAFSATMPSETYLHGTATRLEFITRLPYTIEIPADGQPLGGEIRYASFQWVLYEFRDPKDLRSLLNSDPTLNPSLSSTTAEPSLSLPGKVGQLGPNDFGTLQPPVPKPPDPNESVGLVREAKSWLQVGRDQQRDTLLRQAESTGLLTNGQPATRPLQAEGRDLLEELRTKARGTGRDDPFSTDPLGQTNWAPPPEPSAHRDHLPEVTRLQFRYFDGQTWQLEWLSDDELPAAIEVAFDLDPDAPAARQKEFEEAHARMLDGATLDDVLPPETEQDEETATFAELQDPLSTLTLEDPTAIVTEYRFVIALASQDVRRPADNIDTAKLGTKTEESP